jgi:hypothetical protein
MSVLDAVERDIAEIRKRDEGLADSALAAIAKVLAAQLDDLSNSATSKSMCAKALTETMDRLLELAPAKEVADGVDEVAKQREQRRAAAGIAGA